MVVISLDVEDFQTLAGRLLDEGVRDVLHLALANRSSSDFAGVPQYLGVEHFSLAMSPKSQPL